ncbi:MAG: ABC transporter ATP-binding protein [bacterium]|nr:ABC transporter ATP-binding protein [bacterium]
MNSLCTLKKVYSVIWKQFPKYVIWSIVLALLKITVPFLYIFFVQILTDLLLTDTSLEKLGILCIGFLALNGSISILDNKLSQKLAIWGNELNNRFEADINRCILQLDYEYLENPEILDKRDRAIEGIRENNGTNLSGINLNFIEIVSSAFVMAGTIYMVSTLSFLVMVFLIVTVVVTLIIENKMAIVELDSWKKWVPLNRRFRVVYNLMYDFKNAQDIRLYRTYDFFSKKTEAYNEDSYKVLLEEGAMTSHYTCIKHFLTAIQFLGIQFIVIYQTIQGWITIGEYVMYINAANSFTKSAMTIVKEIASVKKKLLYLNEYFEFLELPRKDDSVGQIIPKKPHKIEFRNVSFRYPGSDTDILRHINISIDLNDKVGIVGRNGAGKTTFVKLLLRFFDPTEGTILLDGIDIKSLDYKEYLSLFAAVFQDFNIYPITIEENITCKSGEGHIEEVMEILRSLQMENKLTKYKNELNTIASKTMDAEGADFSGGEKQMIAMARAIYKDSPILILDEPTASLDAKAENLLYEKYEEFSSGKMSFFISHRLASCIFCDEILVFEQGQIVQRGNHATLMKDVEGLYAQMFTLQAQHYENKESQEKSIDRRNSIEV